MTRLLPRASQAPEAQGASGGASRTVTFISTRSFALSPSTGVVLIWSTTSIPEVTSPKTVYCFASEGCGWRQTKNCVPALSRLEGRRTAATVPRTNGRSLSSAFSKPEAARPVLRRLARVPGERVAALDDPAHDDAVEGRAVVAAGLRRLDEERRVLRRDLRQQADREAPLAVSTTASVPGATRAGELPPASETKASWPRSGRSPPWTGGETTGRKGRGISGSWKHSGVSLSDCLREQTASRALLVHFVVNL